MADINKLILGDNLEILKNIETETVDLIYLDPPFFSNRNYEVIWGDKGEVRSFEDRFSGGIDHYISWLKERVIEMYRILKPTGSIFLHCDYHADAYIKVYILDKIFGASNFKGDIVWQRTNIHSDAKKKLAVLSDTIWYYAKSTNTTYNPVYVEYSQEYKESFFKFKDEKGVYSSGDLSNPKKGGYMFDYKGYTTPVNGWRCPIETMERLDNEGLLIFPKQKTGRVRIKRYIDNMQGILLGNIWLDKKINELSNEEFNLLFNTEEIGNIWNDIQNIQGSSQEKIGYPTQKPMALLQRIIEMASNESDVILDPFVGGGTTVAVADKLNRKWIGIDQSVAAIKVTEARMNNQQDLFSKPFVTQLHKYDYDTLRYKDAFEFESFIITQFGGINNTKQRSDLGLDGKTRENVPIQVKRSDNIGRNVIDNFLSAIKRSDNNLFEKNKSENKEVGFIIAFSFGKGAFQEVARLKNEEHIIIKLVTVEEIIPISKKPKLSVEIVDKGLDKKELREIEFVAKGESDAGIEFYMWDFNFTDNKFNAEVMIDKSGTQNYKFKAGLHKIAIKVIDNEGLEETEIIKLKVNGKIERE